MIRSLIDITCDHTERQGVSIEKSCNPMLPCVRLLPVPPIRMTLAVARVLREFLADPAQPRYGYELMGLTDFPSGKLYPVLTRLVEAGWLSREREDVDASQAGRPARYMYRLTEQGTAAAQRELAGLSEQLAPPLKQQSRPLPNRGHVPGRGHA